MRHGTTTALVVTTIFFATSGLAGAQEKSLQQQLLGSWILESETLTLPGGRKITSWGDKPYGFHSFDSAGNFSQMLIRSDLPKFAERTKGTSEQNDAVAKGAIAYYGTYSVDEAGKAMELRIAGSTFAAFNATASRRSFAFNGPNEMRTTNIIPASGVVAEIVWRRAK